MRHRSDRGGETPAGARRMRDFTQGSILRHILAFSWPMFLGNLLQALYNTVDSFWVGRYLGASALGAVSVSFPIIFALVSVIMGLTMASTTLVAQYRGAQDETQVRRTIANSLSLISVLGLGSTIVGVALRADILRWMRTPVEILEPAAEYLGIFCLGLVPMFVYNAVGSILRGLGDSETPTRYLIHATILNIVLDPLFIIGFGPVPAMGIRGVALATVLAQVLAAALTLRHLVRHTGLVKDIASLWALEKDLVLRLVKIGIPAGLQSVVVSFSMVGLAAIVNGFGATVVAAFGAAGRLDQFAFLPAFSVSLAVTALVGQNLGADKPERVQETVRWSVLLSTLITGGIALVALLRPTPLLRIFTDDPEVLREGADYLHIVGFNYVPFAVMFVIVGVMRGAGDTVPPMVISFITLWVVRIPLAALLAERLGWGVRGVWLSVTVSTLLGLVLNYAYYLSGRWKRRSVIHPMARPLAGDGGLA